jgi:cytochrome c-type biogenesis protein CcmH
VIRPVALAFALACLAAVALAPALAVQPDEVLADPALESRARGISLGVRCLVCQNQSIDDSNADLARDLRRVVRERLVAGDSDQQVLDYLVARYGAFVLLEPPRTRSTWLLWYGPFALLGIGAVGIAIAAVRRARRRDDPVPLSAEERSRLEALLSDDAAAAEQASEARQ